MMATGGRAKSAPASKAKAGAERAEVSAAGADSSAPAVQPLTPRRGLLAVMSVVFAAWMAFLVFLYFTTVYPRRSVAPDSSLSAVPATAADAQSSS